MVQIIDPGPSLGASLGGAVGMGISSGLELLMKDRVTKMQQRRQARALEEVGLPAGLAALDPTVLREFAKSKAQEQAIQSLFGTPAPLSIGEASLGAPPSVSKAALLPGEEEVGIEEVQEAAPGVPLGAARLKEMSTAELQILQGFPAFKDIAKSELDMREKTADVTEKRQIARAKREFQRALPVFKRADDRAETISAKSNSLSLMESAIREGNVGFFSPDNLAELTGIEGFRTAKGALFISAGKEFFLGSLKRAGARPNQWIEQQIQKMLPKIGRSTLANLSVVEALKSEMEVERKGQDLLSDFSDEDDKKYGYIKGNIGQRVRKALKSFADKEQTVLQEKLKDLQRSYSSKKSTPQGILMIDPAGKLRRVPKEDVKKAKEAGYNLK